MKTGKEIRYLNIVDLRAANSADGKTTLSGYAAVFNSRSQDLGGFVEQIAPGAFSKTLREQDVMMLYNHDPSKPMGRMSNGTLSLSQDQRGLKFEMQPDTSISWIVDAVNSIRAGLITQMSFGFATINDNWDMQGDQLVRTLLECQLFEVSPVTFPAYLQTSVNARSYEQKDERDMISYLTEINFPAKKLEEIKNIIATRAKPAVTEPLVDPNTQADTNEDAEAIQERAEKRVQLEHLVARGILLNMEKNHGRITEKAET